MEQIDGETAGRALAVIRPGRPTLATPEILQEIIEWLEDGLSLSSYCRQEGKPRFSTVRRWRDTDTPKGFRAAYMAARECGFEKIGDEIIDIADNSANDYMTRMVGDTEVQVVNHEAIQRSKQRMDARFQLMKIWQPHVWGDKVDHSHKHEVIEPIKTISVEYVRAPERRGTEDPNT